MEKFSDSGNEPAPSWASPSVRDRLVTGIFLGFLIVLAVGAAVVLFVDGRAWVILVAALVSALIWGLRRLQRNYTIESARTWNPLPGLIFPLAVIALVCVAVWLPTFNSYFSGDEFPYIQLFHNLSWSGFLGLFHSDLSQGVLGWSPRELRPFYGLSYRISYSLWGLHPIGYHLTALLLHFINAALVFFLAREFAPDNSWGAAFAGSLFAAQPVNTWVVSSVNGSLTEAVPTLFYISTFLCFLLFRRTCLTRYFALSLVAYVACLLSKETSVTLPFMLVSYDLFQFLAKKHTALTPAPQPRWKPSVRFALAYIPYVVLLLVYLEMRRMAFTTVLREEEWGTHLQEATSSAQGFWLHFGHMVKRLGEIQAFNIRQLMLPFPVAQLCIVLGIYIAFSIILFRHHSECRKSIEAIVFFGFIWYAVTNLPLMATYLDPHHLYLPAIGPCIATAFLIAPVCAQLRIRNGSLRLLAAALLLVFSVVLLLKEDIQWARDTKVIKIRTTQLATALANMPEPALTIVTYPHEPFPYEDGSLSLPYPMEQPFQTSNLYARALVIEDPDFYCCPIDHWWAKSKPILDAVMTGDSDEPVEVHLIAWDNRSRSFLSSTRILPRALLRDYIADSLNAPPDQASDGDDSQAKDFVERLGELISEVH